MVTRVLKGRTGGAVDPEVVAEFAAGIAGEVIGPADAGYDAARAMWNANIVRHPGLIVRCQGAADVIAAVNFARSHALLVAVRGGGHNVAGRALCDDGLVIDLSRMKGVFVDPKRRTVRVQGGATLGDLDRETHVHGLAVPVGVNSTTGIGGLALGGGVGWLVRKYGLTCDNALAFEVVTADGRLVTANAEENTDLFWALRGGGGNFGVVTSFLFQAHPVATVLGGLVVHARDQAPALLRHYRDFMATAPEELTAYAGVLSTPDGMPACAMILCWCGDLDEGERVLQPLRAFGSPLMDAVQPMPYPVMQKLLDGAFPYGVNSYWKSTFVTELSDEVIDLVVARGNAMRSPLSAMVVEFYAGAGSRVGTTDTAFAQRQAEYDIGIIAQWADAAENDTHIAWARETAEALKPYSSGAYYTNFLGEEGQDTIRGAFGPNYDRLAQVKKKYDPTNFFSLNVNIKPAA